MPRTWAQERKLANMRAREMRARRRASRVLIDGRLVASADGINPLPAEYHGKPGTYTNWGCRCATCTDQYTDYLDKYRETRDRTRKQRCE